MTQRTRTLRKIVVAFGILSLTAIGVALTFMPSQHTKEALAAEAGGETRSVSTVRFSENGKLLRPDGYRRWMYVGAPLTPNDMNNGHAAFPEFHSVYVDPDSFDHFEQTGTFKDGTVVIKELISVGGKRATSGHGYFMGDFTGLEVAIKDKARFKDEPGNWAYFSFGHEYPLAKEASPQPVANCSTCHGANADDDYVFSQYYPVLRAAKNPNKTK